MVDDALKLQEEKDPVCLNIMDDSEFDDWRLLYMTPSHLDHLMDAQVSGDPEIHDLPSRLKLNMPGDFKFNLSDVPLTNRQMMAVSLIFCSGIGKAKAAEIMEITHQSLNGHLKSAVNRMKLYYKPQEYYPGNEDGGGELI